MKTSYNLLWLGIRIKSEQDREKEFQMPFSKDKLDNIARISQENPNVDVRLWIDSRRHSKAQVEWFMNLPRELGFQNLVVVDLSDVEDYRREELFYQSEQNAYWRDGRKDSLIWRQVDVAKLLVCTEGDYDRVFYSDLDDVLDIDSEDVISKIERNGFVVCGVFHDDKKPGIENQCFGFDRSKKENFVRLFYLTREKAYQGENGYMTFGNEVRRWMEGDIESVCVRVEHSGVLAWHPDESGIMSRGYSTLLGEGFGQFK